MIKILIAGDFCPHKRVERLVLENKPEKIFNNFMPYLQGNDLNVVNLECPLIQDGKPINKIGPHLKAREECIEAIKFGNFQLVTLANNHIMDQGIEGLSSTLKLCNENNIAIVGAGFSFEEASRICIKEIDNQKIAFLNFCENEFSTVLQNQAGANPLNPVKNFYSIQIAKQEADYVIVIIHGGHEGYSLPSPRMVETYRFFVDAGADLVVGHHSHCYSGYEEYKSGMIFYGLGNFIFDWEGMINNEWNMGYVIKLSIDNNKTTFQMVPYKQCNEEPGMFLLNEPEEQHFRKSIQRLNEIVANDGMLHKEWHKFAQSNRNSYLMDLECSESWLYRALRYRRLIPEMLSKNKKKRLLNLFLCESHRDLTIECLQPVKDMQ